MRSKFTFSTGPYHGAIAFDTMTGMKRLFCLLGLGAVLIMPVPDPAAAQTGAIEFYARITPSGGVSEPVRNIPFYLLSKSFQDIRTEAEAAEPKPDFDSFIDKLAVSPELKAWMKKNHTVSLTGEEFTQHLKADDVLKIPEFFTAYLAVHAGEQAVGFPAPKYHEKDRDKDPAKYDKLRQDYLDAIRKYFGANPQSADGMDLHLVPIDPSHNWQQLEAKRVPEVRRRSLDAAQGRYLVARTETDLEGRGVLNGVTPGNYWLGTLDLAADVGDMRLSWDAPVTIRPGAVTRLELSNINALELHKPSSNP
jgi:hypothetical protein